MRNLVLLFSALVLGTSGALATSTNDDKVAERNAYGNNNSFIFVEDGITFSVYPDGEFDFYIENYVSGRRDGITFNSGYDYSPYAQYDDYGAVIQVENIPIYYDYYGRVTQIGSVDISYRNNRVFRMGGMYVYYNNRGFYDYHTGYINIYNRAYVYRPFHSFFVRPALGFCLVFNSPYRRYYTPYRYTYYSPYRYNQRHAYAKIGQVHRYNKVRNERSTIYRNDKRVAIRENNVRSNRRVDARGEVSRSNQRVAARGEASRSNQGTTVRNSTVRSNDLSSSRTTVRKNDGDMGRTVAKRSVTQTPSSRSTVSKTPSVRENTRAVRSSDSRNQRGVAQKSVKREAPKTVSRSSNNVSSRSSSSGRSVQKASSRSSQSSTRSATARSRGGQEK